MFVRFFATARIRPIQGNAEVYVLEESKLVLGVSLLVVVKLCLDDIFRYADMRGK